MENTSGLESLDNELRARYPEYKIHANIGYNSSEIYAGILVKENDYTLNKALSYYYNINFSFKDILNVKPFPC